MPRAHTEDQFTEQPATGLFAELGCHQARQTQHLRRTHDLLLPRLPSGQVELDVSLSIQQTSGTARPA